MLKHLLKSWRNIKNYNEIHSLMLNLNPHLESQVASISDDVAYNNHDVEDAIRAGLITNNQLNEVVFFNDIINDIKSSRSIELCSKSIHNQSNLAIPKISGIKGLEIVIQDP